MAHALGQHRRPEVAGAFAAILLMSAAVVITTASLGAGSVPTTYPADAGSEQLSVEDLYPVEHDLSPAEASAAMEQQVAFGDLMTLLEEQFGPETYDAWTHGEGSSAIFSLRSDDAQLLARAEELAPQYGLEIALIPELAFAAQSSALTAVTNALGEEFPDMQGAYVDIMTGAVVIDVVQSSAEQLQRGSEIVRDMLADSPAWQADPDRETWLVVQESGLAGDSVDLSGDR